MTSLLGKKIGLTWRANPIPQEQAFKAMKAALDNGANFWNGGEFYGTPDRNSLHLLNEYFTKYPEDADKVVLSIKGGMGEDRMPDGTEEGVQKSVDNCLKLLDGKKHLDIFECARVDPRTPIETTIAALAKYVKAGKISGISLSEVRAETIRRAHKVHPICCVEVEFSLWSTDILTNGITETCAELNIPIIAYSPLGRGFLTGQIKKFEDIPEDDFVRRSSPRFQPDVFSKNVDLVIELEKVAKKKGCAPAQLGLAWVKATSARPGMPVIIPIPGATTVDKIVENQTDVELSDADMDEINAILRDAVVIGGRYPEGIATLNNG
ncbi:MAG: Pyridoxine 4-dehydrogenase [Candelina mexicana]|nr:MAG: Pyridoxine 4-dehydrogenase [Candelina mexicana]